MSKLLRINVILLMVMKAAAENDTTTTTTTSPTGQLLLLTTTNWTEAEDTAPSLGARRSACFQTPAAAGGGGGPAGLAAANESVDLFSSFSPSLTCNASLLVHHTLMELWAQLAAPVVCRELEAYGEVSKCLLEATKSCVPAENRVHFPDKDMVQAGFRYVCEVAAADQFDVDVVCARDRLQAVLNCIQQDVGLVAGTPSLSSATLSPRLVCRTFDIADFCYWDSLQICGKQTAAAYTRMVSLYFRPPSCLSSASKLNTMGAITSLILTSIAAAWSLNIIVC